MPIEQHQQKHEPALRKLFFPLKFFYWIVYFQGMDRQCYLANINASFKSHRIVALLGPRQVGKSTLSNHYSKKYKNQVHFFDLEDPTDLARLESPKLALQDLKGLIIIDESQRRPELFPILRVLADRADKKTSQFLILGP